MCVHSMTGLFTAEDRFLGRVTLVVIEMKKIIHLELFQYSHL